MDSGAQAQDPSRLDGARVLVVEDDPLVARTVCRALERSGAQVRACGSLDEAYGALQGDGGTFDAAVVDLGLPDGTGFALVSALRAHACPCASVVITGIVDGNVVRRCMDGAVSALLPKPFDHGGVIRAVLRAVDQTRTWRAWCDAVGLAEAVAEAPNIGDTERLVGDLVRRGQLTARERETLELLLKGAQNVEIAEHLGISSNTVKYHVRNLLRKLGFESRTDLFRALARSRGD